ncbi:glutamate--tRNA ligase 1 [Helicobacter heilmannii]|uniref:Glutamate--tRNA ligase n=2 Tax=Helicobacter heilmannii TaxID=35817 RepID=A0A0K2YB92_HELHE|nr:glutamate--tRNA ligase [Helicobacter heilmannii]BDQ27181.1 glutamate--tRNA ligase 1 [Helicobacter heilmannii]CCM12131.1 Glutamyl-tRNA synthetase [Helicobacter heilmannii ASB1.4]CRI34240.1 Glutamyl-tRNA synthetase [Helicobacter heilmannii]
MVTTRFAPSPTGHLHIGGLRTALFNYLYARSCRGRFYLRIEDTDLDRNVKEATEAILKAFEWVGLEVDGEIWYQSQRLDIYQRYIQQLLDAGKAYYCYMSKEELEALRETQRAQGLTPRYDRRYRDFKGTPPSGIEPVVRIKAPLSGEVHFKDGVKGEVCVQAEELDDFVIARSNGVPTYNFVVTIDDALMGISDVIRGDDHLSNTPKQIILYEALGFKIPNFYHVPMILNESGHKLSKRDGAMGVMDYKALGYLKDALLNFLVRLGWSHQDQEIFSLQEMKEFFNPKDLNSAPSCFSPHKLEWLNSHYLKESSVDRLKALLADFNLPSNFYALSPAQQNTLLEALKSRVSTLKEMAIEIAKVLNTPTSYALNKLKNRDQALEVLKTLMTGLKEQDFSSVESLDATLHAFMADSRLKAGALMLPLRIALLGEAGGIGVKEALFILGYKMSLERLKAFLAL